MDIKELFATELFPYLFVSEAIIVKKSLEDPFLPPVVFDSRATSRPERFTYYVTLLQNSPLTRLID